jgi:hypothetical protein
MPFRQERSPKADSWARNVDGGEEIGDQMDQVFFTILQADGSFKPVTRLVK